MKKGLKLLGLGVGVVAIMALTLGGAVFADTPEEADTQSNGGWFGWHGFHGFHSFHGEGAGFSEELLGLTTDELCDLRQEGKSLAEIAAEQGVTVDELMEAMMAEKTAVVQARVDAGTLTQEQADLILQQMAEMTELAVNRTTAGPAGWHMGGGFGMFNRWGGQNGGSACYGDAGTGPGGMGGMRQWGQMAY